MSINSQVPSSSARRLLATAAVAAIAIIGQNNSDNSTRQTHNSSMSLFKEVSAAVQRTKTSSRLMNLLTRKQNSQREPLFSEGEPLHDDELVMEHDEETKTDESRGIPSLVRQLSEEALEFARQMSSPREEEKQKTWWHKMNHQRCPICFEDNINELDQDFVKQIKREGKKNSWIGKQAWKASVFGNCKGPCYLNQCGRCVQELLQSTKKCPTCDVKLVEDVSQTETERDPEENFMVVNYSVNSRAN